MMMDQQQQQLPPEKLHQPRQQQQQQQHQHQQHQAGPDGRLKRNPYCSRCRNHGKSAQVKGHKRHCEYRNCQCEGCKLVECRQIVSAAQIKRRRYQKQDEECGRRIEISPPVLTRTVNSDSATLIAKTLISSKQNSSTKHFAAAVAAAAAGGATPTAAAMAAVSQHAHEQLQMHMGGSGMPAAFTRSAVGPALTSAQAAVGLSVPSSASTTTTTTLASAWPQHTPPSLSNGHAHLLPVANSACRHLLHLDTNQHHHHHHHHLGPMASRLGPPLSNNGGVALMVPTSGVAQPPQPPQPLMNNHQHVASSHLLDQSAHTQTSAGGSPNLTDALHLFHFHHPNSMFSGATFVSHPGASNVASGLHLTQLAAQPPPPPYSQLANGSNLSPSTRSSPKVSEIVERASAAESCGLGSLSAIRSPPETAPAPGRLGPPTPASCSPTSHGVATNNSLSSHEQLSLVKEISRSHGPLVVYAWLRSERFNVAKVRALIDMAEDRFDELLQANGHSPLDLTSPIVD